MAGLFGSSNAKSPPPGIGALTLQQSSYATPIPLVYGTNRISGNLLWYGAFTQVLVSTGGGGGKGGVVGGGGKGGGSQEYQYNASFAIGICEGPGIGVGQVWVSKQISTINELNGQTFGGGLDQAPWGYLSSNFPDAADGYNSLAYAAFPNFSLGTSAEMPQFSFEVIGLEVFGSGIQDASPDQVVIDFLTRAQIATALIDTYASFAAYCQAMGFFISPMADQQRQANDWLNEWITNTLNSEFVFTNGKLTLVPRGDAPASGNGATYIPNLTPIYNIGDDDFIVGDNEDPVTVERSDLQDAYNQMPIEYCNRGDQYNLETFTAEDAAHIDQFGVRTAPSLVAHHITDPGVAQNIAYLALWKQIYIDHGPQFKFKLPWNFILLDPMDLISISDANLGLVNKLVRVKSINEDEDGVLQFVCEDMPGDLASIAQYNMVAPDKYAANYNQEAPNVNQPIFFETPLALLQKAAVEIGVGISGAGSTWGGSQVWVSADGDTYQYLTLVNGANRMGVLTAALASFTPAPGGNNIDATNTLSVDMTESAGVFQNAAVDGDAIANNSLCFVDGEFISFGQDNLTASFKYDLTYLNRGAYGSPIGAHAIGASFLRVDQSVLRMDVDQTRVGQTIYFKFLSFNQWGGGMQNLSEVSPYPYVIQGSALFAALDDPGNLAVSYSDNIATLNWSPISDVRSPIFYEIRKGSVFESAQVVATTAQTNYPVFGSDTYWVTGVYFAPTGAPVYSVSPPNIVVSTPSIQQNLIEMWDEASTGWSGTCSGAAALVSGSIEVGTAATGTYTAPSGHQIDSNYIINAKVIMSWSIAAVNIAASDVTAMSDVTTIADITGAVSSGLVLAQPQIRLSQDGGTTWGPWQNWVAGVYTFNAIQYRINMTVLLANVTAILSQLSIDVDVPLRTDTGTVSTSSSADVTVTYPGGKFNFVPVVTPTILNAVAGDDLIFGTSPGLTNFSFSVWNAGGRVVRSVNWAANGS